MKLSNLEKVLIGVVIVSASLFSIKSCQDSNKEDKLIHNIQTYSDSAKYYKGLGNVTIAYNKTLELKNKQQIKDYLSKDSTNKVLLNELRKFKRVDNVIVTQTNTLIQHDTILLSDSIPCDFAPIRVRKDNGDYSFSGTITQKSFYIDSLEIPNKISIIVGRRKTGFMKSELNAIIYNSNPLVSNSNIASLTIKEEKKFYQKTWFHMIVGGIIGGAITYKLVK